MNIYVSNFNPKTALDMIKCAELKRTVKEELNGFLALDDNVWWYNGVFDDDDN